MRPLRQSLLVLAAVLVAAAAASAQRVPPPTWARSVEVLDDGAEVVRAPSAGAKRRGTVRVHTRLPLLERVAGEGCSTGTWVRVGPELYICEGHVRPSPEPPGGEPLPRVAPGELLPREYAFVAFDGTRAYAHPRDAEVDDYVEALGEGFGVVIVGHAMYGGEPYAQTRRGLWIHEDALRRARGSSFQGVRLGPEEPLDLAWVVRRTAPIHARPEGAVVRQAGHREIVRVRGEARRRGWVELTDGTSMRDAHLARAVPVPRPEGVGPDERWIDVSVAEQVLVAYEGDRPVFATLVSTGRAGASHETPLGLHRVWAKLAFSDMSNLGREDVPANYAISQVPWVQYFEGANGLHAAFWHDDFGHRRSHGCVNLSPQDARTLFDWTTPTLPAGWKAILPDDRDRATAVQVR